ncbi:cytidylate kinase [Halobacteroides halobius DSM 5150]|uniref:Cytidylate kinase n=1 Tax=Halobacteroides halobius (strain ATCC 35273 / DSM 5150 / MD-1) TaxID=748449 RepID=L0K7W1_HALHC|nr:(d)CMP kinase [Halobacteroides halobius]AGB41347.1 cytidylate kinase [Halobacteroides halobius DSM 5150]
MNKELTVAIDGPAGAGKSTVAKIVADKLEYIYIDTGAMYRALTLKALQEDIDLTNKADLVKIAQQAKISFSKNNKQERILLDQQDVTSQIRTKRVNNHVSLVAKVAGVRKELVKAQRKLATCCGVVMDGRDIGTVVLPNADVKIFLTASVEERTTRRFQQLKDKGVNVNFAELKEEIIKRDQLDRNREVGPLQKADDAVEIDTTDLDKKDVINKIISICQEV